MIAEGISKEEEFTKLRMWTAEEDDVLKAYYFDISLSHNEGQSRWDYLSLKLKECLGDRYRERTEKAIMRRCLRIGLKCFSVDNPMIDVICENCSQSYRKAERYVSRDEKNICPLCQKINGGYSSRERYLKYHKKYYKEYLKKDIGGKFSMQGKKDLLVAMSEDEDFVRFGEYNVLGTIMNAQEELFFELDDEDVLKAYHNLMEVLSDKRKALIKKLMGEKENEDEGIKKVEQI